LILPVTIYSLKILVGGEGAGELKVTEWWRLGEKEKAACVVGFL